MLKLVAKFGRSTGGNLLERRDDFDVLADIALMVNSLFEPASLAGDVGDLIAPSLAVSVEIENPPDVASSLLRAHDMLGTFLAAEALTNPFARRLETIFLFTTGLNFDDLQNVTFALWSYTLTLTVDELVEDQRKAHFNPYSAGNVISAEYLTATLDRYSIHFDNVPGLPFGAADARAFLYDHTALKASPIWKIGDDNYFCFDPAFLQERLASGVYWTVMNALLPSDRDEFARLWGRLFERHLWKVLESIWGRDRVWRGPRYLDNSDEAWDAVIDYGDTLVVIQAKGGFIPAASKYSADTPTFLAALQRTFGDVPHGALHQLKTNLLACFGVENRRPMAELDRRRTTQVFPLVVYNEPLLRFGLTTRRLAKQFDEWLSTAVFRLGLTVRPTMFMHVNDFQVLAPYIRSGDTTLVDVLNSKLSYDRDHVTALGNFWVEHEKPARGYAQRGDDVMKAEWHAFAESALERMKRGDYQ